MLMCFLKNSSSRSLLFLSLFFVNHTHALRMQVRAGLEVGSLSSSGKTESDTTDCEGPCCILSGTVLDTDCSWCQTLVALQHCGAGLESSAATTAAEACFTVQSISRGSPAGCARYNDGRTIYVKSCYPYGSTAQSNCGSVICNGCDLALFPFFSACYSFMWESTEQWDHPSLSTTQRTQNEVHPSFNFRAGNDPAYARCFPMECTECITTAPACPPYIPYFPSDPALPLKKDAAAALEEVEPDTTTTSNEGKRETNTDYIGFDIWGTHKNRITRNGLETSRYGTTLSSTSIDVGLYAAAERSYCLGYQYSGMDVEHFLIRKKKYWRVMGRHWRNGYRPTCWHGSYDYWYGKIPTTNAAEAHEPTEAYHKKTNNGIIVGYAVQKQGINGAGTHKVNRNDPDKQYQDPKWTYPTVNMAGPTRDNALWLVPIAGASIWFKPKGMLGTAWFRAIRRGWENDWWDRSATRDSEWPNAPVVTYYTYEFYGSWPQTYEFLDFKFDRESATIFVRGMDFIKELGYKGTTAQSEDLLYLWDSVTLAEDEFLVPYVEIKYPAYRKGWGRAYSMQRPTDTSSTWWAYQLNNKARPSGTNYKPYWREGTWTQTSYTLDCNDTMDRTKETGTWPWPSTGPKGWPTNGITSTNYDWARPCGRLHDYGSVIYKGTSHQDRCTSSTYWGTMPDYTYSETTGYGNYDGSYIELVAYSPEYITTKLEKPYGNYATSVPQVQNDMRRRVVIYWTSWKSNGNTEWSTIMGHSNSYWNDNAE